MNSTSQQDDQHADSVRVDYLFHEYERVNTWKLAEEAQGEQRMQFFLTIVSAAAGALVFLASQTSADVVKVNRISQVVLLILFLFGVTLLNRMIARRAKLRAYEGMMRQIEEQFLAIDASLEDYITRKQKSAAGAAQRPMLARMLIRNRGTLSDFAVIINSLVAGGVVYLQLTSVAMGESQSLLWSVLAAVGIYVLQRFYYDLMNVS